MPRIVIIAGEASGDQLARGLIESLRERYPDAIFEGITGPQMRAAGCVSWGDYEELAVMGIAEVLRHLPRLLRFKKSLERRLLESPPDLLIGVDAPDFNLRLEKFARTNGIPTVHYVCPSVWAWRSGRVKTIRAACDLVLCLLPFERDFVQRHGIRASFVGHPLADEIGEEQWSADEIKSLAPGKGPVLAVLPGSRRGEIERLGKVFLAAASRVRDKFQNLQIISAAANQRTEAQFAEVCRSLGMAEQVAIYTGRTRQVMAAADVVLVTSGTATLEVMLMRKPMVVAYKASPFTAWFLRVTRLIKIRYFSFPNLLAGYELVPEFIQERAAPDALGDALIKQMNSGEDTAKLLEKFENLSAQLRQSASSRAADAVAELLEERRR